jgi:cation/acetate symporter
VVAGLTLSGAAALTHDLWTHVVRSGRVDEKEQMKVARWASAALGVVAIGQGLIFKGQNVAFMVGLAFAIAASANLPVLLLSMAWKRFTTRGAVASVLTGTVSSLILITLSPTIWVDVLHNASALFPLKNPAIVSMPLAILAGVIVSLAQREPTAEAQFAEVTRRMELGSRA